MEQQTPPPETPPAWQLRAVRGATSVEVDTPNAIQTAVGTLLKDLVAANNIAPNDICTVFFTVTDDLHAISPAKVARLTLPWHHVALFTSVEPAIEGLPSQIIRVLIQFYTDKQPHALTHVYQNAAQQLRPDRVAENV
jgi:chorismate mutase